ncbi:TrmH family RNA methyltransferase [Clostridium pascui]|uniref:TrmH family RNA methyltransferase n=1 Tax=Clostridium pascui TaxID=46609 RepID=UPI00195A341D|nr:RNA methyltransferase [Clostridium pascui]MBM7870070.1 TrmH family RNA methyltransferase [Clostridium pascui]
MERITSKDNSSIKEVRKLKEKKHRSFNKKFLVEGFRFVEEAIKSNFYIEELFIAEEALEKFYKYNFKYNIMEYTKIYSVEDKLFKTIGNTENPQGILAIARYKDTKIKDTDGFYILADRIQDPGNMGTIIRSAHAAGALGVILTKGTVDVYNDKTLRSTMGSIFHIPIIEDTDLSITKTLQNNQFKILVSSLEESQDFYDINLNKNIIICVGNEGSGISDEILKLSDEKFKIPMPGKAESLNVAVAASVMMFERVRQNLKKVDNSI